MHPALVSDNRVFRDAEVEGAIEVPLKAEDAILFVDALARGADYRTNNNGRFSPQEEDVPLRDWIKTNLGEEAVVA